MTTGEWSSGCAGWHLVLRLYSNENVCPAGAVLSSFQGAGGAVLAVLGGPVPAGAVLSRSKFLCSCLCRLEMTQNCNIKL